LAGDRTVFVDAPARDQATPPLKIGIARLPTDRGSVAWSRKHQRSIAPNGRVVSALVSV